MKRPVMNRLKAYYEPGHLGPEALFRQRLGACVMLDMHYWGGVLEQPVEAYCATVQEAVRQGRVLILCDAEARPVAYAVWDGGPVILRQSAPFGDFVALYDALQARLADCASMTVHHPGAPAPEQRLW